jgi:hypothetical protein
MADTKATASRFSGCSRCDRVFVWKWWSPDLELMESSPDCLNYWHKLWQSPLGHDFSAHLFVTSLQQMRNRVCLSEVILFWVCQVRFDGMKSFIHSPLVVGSIEKPDSGHDLIINFQLGQLHSRNISVMYIHLNQETLTRSNTQCNDRWSDWTGKLHSDENEYKDKNI